MWLQVFIPTKLTWLADPNQVCSCLVGMKTSSHMALYWISLTHMVYAFSSHGWLTPIRSLAKRRSFGSLRYPDF